METYEQYCETARQEGLDPLPDWEWEILNDDTAWRKAGFSSKEAYERDRAIRESFRGDDEPYISNKPKTKKRRN